MSDPPPTTPPPLTAVPPSVPAAVGEVTVSNNGRTDFLSVSWRPSPGEVDGYLVSLSDRDRTLHLVSVSRSSPECVFNSLVSGRLYNISIGSRSGLFYNHTLVQERTRESSTTRTESPDPPPPLRSHPSCQMSLQNPLRCRTPRWRTPPETTPSESTGATPQETWTSTRCPSNTTTPSCRTERSRRRRTSACSPTWCPAGSTPSWSAPGAGTMRPAPTPMAGPVSDL